MARRCKSYEEQIEALNQQISKTEEKLNLLVSQRDQLLERKQQEELSELYSLIQEYNLTVDDISELIKREETNRTVKTA